MFFAKLGSSFGVLLILVHLADGFKNQTTARFLVEEEDALLTVPQLIRKYGYQVQEHQVETPDGYLLGMYRIIPRRPSRKHPVFMMHSLFSSCSDWVLIGRQHGLAYLLSNLGYDVWMGNARGTRYSRKHKLLSTKNPTFWDFSFHEIGFYDVTSLIDYVLDQTAASKLHYVGFSQGAMTAFVALSSRPEYNDKIIQLHALSPAVYMYRSLSSFLRLLSVSYRQLAQVFIKAGQYEIIPNFEQQYFLFRWLCPAPAQTLCRSVIYDIVGANPDQLDVRMLRIFFGHFPAGASLKQVGHYAQIIRDGLFRQVDYEDPVLNRAAYGGYGEVPRYNLSQVTAPVRTYFGYNDNTVNYLNVLQLEQEVPNVIGSYPVPDKRFSHIDFILANSVREVLYEEIVRNIEGSDGRNYH
ncbi:lipase 1-like [Uranotaenia lowii]|uniref:lipase 1-like n=1 Tax=Uranotaenia lowii TaxID=190385 RepID=UPI00247ADB9D|nr:lipase 1-like [Uranotaenia lowii]